MHDDRVDMTDMLEVIYLNGCNTISPPLKSLGQYSLKLHILSIRALLLVISSSLRSENHFLRC